GDKIYFTATKDSPLETHLYVTSVSKNGAIEKLTKEPGTHYITMSADGNHFVDQYSNLETPNTLQIINATGKVVETLLQSANPLANHTVGTTTIETLKAADGQTDLYARLIKPYNFDANKKYPVIVYVYGGPHSQLVTNSWLAGGDLFLNYLAQQGYVVWTLDNRGTDNRGFEFQSATHRQLGTVETADQMKGVNYLKSLPYVDSTRIGVDGWSFGGFMAISLKLRYPGVFKVATAGGPVIDWKWYEIMYTERYMETPEENPDGYKTASVLNYVDNLQGKLLLIHGAQDNTVVWQQSLGFIEECIKKNKQVDYFVYPNHAHNVRGIERMHLYQKLYDYFRENL
ncbi:MAG: prolyl oligopeptidase family serine peptidase, partial [Bacteroidales bacterium]|nr:prolyl oligopeptidase family serine peptidase [Bacteroidales bacterium]